MIETAKKHANAPVPGVEESAPAVTEESGESKEADVVEGTETVKDDEKLKAETAPAAEEEEDKEDSDDPAQIEMRRERAKRILKALGAR